MKAKNFEVLFKKNHIKAIENITNQEGIFSK